MSEYRRSLFDKHGPAAADRVRAFSYATIVFGLTFGAITLATGRLSLGTFLIAAVAGVGAASATLLLSNAVGGGWAAMTISGASTPYEEQYSYQQALVMQGKVADALASYEEIIARSPNDATPRIRAAELYAQQREGARRAAELFREALHLPTIAAGQEIYATNRLVDLLIGPLRQPGRAVVELRRLVDRYPGSTAAIHAREALARIKQTLIADQSV